MGQKMTWSSRSRLKNQEMAPQRVFEEVGQEVDQLEEALHFHEEPLERR
jgi:hypothetical protein